MLAACVDFGTSHKYTKYVYTICMYIRETSLENFQIHLYGCFCINFSAFSSKLSYLETAIIRTIQSKGLRIILCAQVSLKFVTISHLYEHPKN